MDDQEPWPLLILAGAEKEAAKEWRRVNRLPEEQWERSTERAMAVAEEASGDALPSMWAVF